MVRSDFDIAGELTREAMAGGGITLALNGGEVPARGYVVGGVATVSVPGDTDTDDVTELARSLVGWAITSGIEYVGSWQDEITGRLYFDAVSIVGDRATAESIGRERGELAIWHLDGSIEVRL